MTRREALAELIEKVEAGGDDTPDFLDVVSRPFIRCKAGEAYRGSLDAAKELHEAVLPGYRWEGYQGECFRVWQPDKPEKFTEGCDCHPARAWLLAILIELHAEEPDT